MPWNFDSERPIYSQILEHIRIQIVSGYYQPGDKLPSVRELATQANVNPNTMQKALTELERCNLIITQRTSGRSVTEDIDMIKETQKELAAEKIKVFLESMKALGFQKPEIIALIETAN